MFILRSIFWLALAFVVIVPKGGAPDAAALAQGTLEAGRSIVATQVDQIACTSIECAGGKAVLTAVLSSSRQVVAPMQDSPTTDEAPVPRPRLNRAG